MHFNLSLAILFAVFLPFLCAIPLDSDGPSQLDSDRDDVPTSTPSKSTSTTFASKSTSHAVTHRPIPGTNTRKPVRRPTSTKKQPFATNRPISSTPRPHWVPPPQPPASATPFVGRHAQGPNESAAAIVFEVLGALAGILLFLGLMRCVYNYHRTPHRDRIAVIMHRHQLQREMDELARNPPERRRASMEPPPPAYIAPPVYLDVAPHPDDEDETGLLTRDQHADPNG
ncbi:hypothetical protein FB45DRAFT_1023855 [Roridomyces roridus]|uniref:Transmembrane protein n=1 Tax=Roridomyces roridus TaxID=1738132 RepID=A0AAD7C571_9AGAR|nr:hypothetical protein FB45DRAFT_1023855 [Roridomyces roridus]